MTTPAVYKLKQGATLSLGGTKELPAGTWSATAQVKQAAGTAVDTLTVTLTPPVAPATAHTILIVGTSVQTVDWPLEKLECDVRFVDASVPPVVLPTDTFVISVQERITSV